MSEPHEDDSVLSEQIVSIDALRIARGVNKRCRCLAARFLVDEDVREVTCRDCGARVDPFDACLRIMRHYDSIRDDVLALQDQQRRIADYKPHLRIMQRLEREYRGKKMLPVCPVCGEAFYFERITGWTNREIHERQHAAGGDAQ